jgi:signal peptidase I
MNFNFELILFYATLITGLYALFDVLFLAPKRKAKQQTKIPLLSDYARSFFPVLLIVFLLRSFLFEPFRIPTGSLEPSLLIGDFILLNKYDYGVHIPIVHKKIFNVGEPQRGDIMVFYWPANPAYYFIKRVIGLPGDHISYVNKELTINGQKVPQLSLPNPGQENDAIIKEEDLLGVKHKIYIRPERNSRDYPDIVVPKGMYFVMGDNRDLSADSRYFGFVPEENIVGKAVFVWMSWDKENSNIRWQRIGRI